jgi:hypothetical protein
MAQGEFRDAYMKHSVFHTFRVGRLIFCAVALFQILFPKMRPPMSEAEKHEVQQLRTRQRADDARRCALIT